MDAHAALPPHQDLPCAWFGPAMAARTDWRVSPGEALLDELHAAAERLLPDGAALAGADPQALRAWLPTVAPWMDGIRRELLQGRGFVLVRGLPVQAWGRRTTALAFMLLGACLGPARPQNAAGHLLGHVRDLGLRSDDPNVRIYQTHERQTYHTDSCDIVGLLCLQTARRGGRSALVSSVTLFNEMRRLRPDLAAAMFRPVATDRRGEVPPGQAPYFEIPVMNWWPAGAQGALSTIYQRQYIESAQRFPEAPRLDATQREALDLFDALSNDPRLHFLMDLEPGDVQLVHNHSLLHDRTAFEDWPEPERRRHLLRLWLAPPDARPLPPVFAQRYGSVTPGARGGVCLPTAPWNIPWDGLEPATGG